MNLWLSDYIAMANDCVARESRLTDWERTFIDSVKHQLDTTESISPKQVDVLKGIWEKVTRRG